MESQLSREEAVLMLGPPSDAQRQAIDLKRGEVPAISPRCESRRRAERFGLRDVEGLVVHAGFRIRLQAALLLRMLLASGSAGAALEFRVARGLRVSVFSCRVAGFAFED